MAERTPGAPPRVWAAVAAIADDLAQLARRVEEQLTDMERMQLDNLVLRLDRLADRLPAGGQGQMRPWRQARQQEKEGAPMSDPRTPGEVAYAAFTRIFDPQHVQWRRWPDVPRKMQLAWEAAARAVRAMERPTPEPPAVTAAVHEAHALLTMQKEDTHGETL